MKPTPHDPLVHAKRRGLYAKIAMAGFTGIAITVSHILFATNFPRDTIEILPLYISLAVMLLQTEANRYTFLLGGINSIFYAAVYVSFGVYASATSALLVSFPLQIIAFINWGKHRYGKNSAEFKKLGTKKLLLVIGLSAVAFAICYTVYRALGSQHLILDNISMVLGILVPILSAVPYIEYVWFNLISQVMSIGMAISLALHNPERIPYLIYAIFCLVCVILANIRIHQLYKEQQTRKKEGDDIRV